MSPLKGPRGDAVSSAIPLDPTNLQSIAPVRLDLGRIRSAVFSIAPIFRNTPQYVCPPLSEALGCELILKLETANPIRCFKGRGTETVMTRLVNSGAEQRSVRARVISGRRWPIAGEAAESRQRSSLAGRRERLQTGADTRIGRDRAYRRRRHRGCAPPRSTNRKIARTHSWSKIARTSTPAKEPAPSGSNSSKRIEPDRRRARCTRRRRLATGVGYVFKCLAPQVEIVGVQPRGAPAMALSWRSTFHR